MSINSPVAGRATWTYRGLLLVASVLFGRFLHDVWWPLRAATIWLSEPLTDMARTDEGLWFPASGTASEVAAWMVSTTLVLLALVAARVSRARTSAVAEQWRKPAAFLAFAIALTLLGGTLQLLLSLSGRINASRFQGSAARSSVVVAIWSSHDDREPVVLVLAGPQSSGVAPRASGLPFDGVLPHRRLQSENEMKNLISDLLKSGFFSLPPATSLAPDAWGHWYYLVGVYDGYRSHQTVGPWDASDSARLERIVRFLDTTRGLGLAAAPGSSLDSSQRPDR